MKTSQNSIFILELQVLAHKKYYGDLEYKMFKEMQSNLLTPLMNMIKDIAIREYELKNKIK